jgi:hypothetical protein
MKNNGKIREGRTEFPKSDNKLGLDFWIWSNETTQFFRFGSKPITYGNNTETNRCKCWFQCGLFFYITLRACLGYCIVEPNSNKCKKENEK